MLLISCEEVEGSSGGLLDGDLAGYVKLLDTDGYFLEDHQGTSVEFSDNDNTVSVLSNSEG